MRRLARVIASAQTRSTTSSVGKMMLVSQSVEDAAGQHDALVGLQGQSVVAWTACR
jgi:hypothetical protein